MCDGGQPVYQLSIGAAQAFRAQLTDLAPGGSVTDLSGSAAATYKATRPQFYLVVAPQDVELRGGRRGERGDFRSTASRLGEWLSIFGVGLFGPGKATAVDMDGTTLRLLLATPFQINAEVPLEMAPGVHSLRVQSAYGSAQQSVMVSAVAPGIFLVGNPPIGAITNTNYSLIGPSNPLPRGQVDGYLCHRAGRSDTAAASFR